jgi:hypothetical protein
MVCKKGISYHSYQFTVPTVALGARLQVVEQQLSNWDKYGRPWQSAVAIGRAASMKKRPLSLG